VKELENMDESELGHYYPEFMEYMDQCRFRGCRHENEPDCSVKDAVEKREYFRLQVPQLYKAVGGTAAE
jgi:ribosome biogenesis GTPase